MPRWPVAGPSGYWPLASSPATKVNGTLEYAWILLQILQMLVHRHFRFVPSFSCSFSDDDDNRRRHHHYHHLCLSRSISCAKRKLAYVHLTLNRFCRRQTIKYWETSGQYFPLQLPVYYWTEPAGTFSVTLTCYSQFLHGDCQCRLSTHEITDLNSLRFQFRWRYVLNIRCHVWHASLYLSFTEVGQVAN